MSRRHPCDRLRDILDAVARAVSFGQSDRGEMAHEYHRVDGEFVWGTVDVDLPPLREATTAELERLGC